MSQSREVYESLTFRAFFGHVVVAISVNRCGEALSKVAESIDGFLDQIAFKRILEHDFDWIDFVAKFNDSSRFRQMVPVDSEFSGPKVISERLSVEEFDHQGMSLW